MSTNQTKNLHLHSWDPLDRFTREEFNDNWNGIDAAWGDLEGRLLADVEALATETAERKTADATLQKNIDAEAAARKSADDALQTNINAKANTTALTTETSERKAADAALQAMFEGRPKMVIGTYVGKVASGSASGTAIQLGFRPKVLFVRALDAYSSVPKECRFAMAVDGYATKFSAAADIAIGDTSFTAYTHPSGPHFCDSGVTYLYVAFA